MKKPAAHLKAMERQFQIYLDGLRGQFQAVPVSPDALEQQAKAALKPEAFEYVACGAGSGDTMRANLEAFKRWRIVPRMLHNVDQRDLRVQLLDAELPAPVLLAPIGVQSIVHPEGEMAVAQAAASLGIPIVLSTASSSTIEQISQAMGDVPRWFQLYWSKDPDLAASFVSRAEQAGYSALVVTLDTMLLGWREKDLQNAYLPFLTGQGLANYLTDPAFRKSLARPPEEDPQGAIQRFADVFADPALTWKDLACLRERTRLPILLKGILRPDDAAKALDHGAHGIIVSNHGGRQVDGAIAALDALPGVVREVRGRVPVLFDSGIRRGADAVKALALGASAILLGRPYMWGLALAGEEGVRAVVMNFLADLELTLALSGYCSVRELREAGAEALAPQPMGQ